MSRTAVLLRVSVIGIAALLAATHSTAGPARASTPPRRADHAPCLSVARRASPSHGDGLFVDRARSGDLDDDERWRVLKPSLVALSDTFLDRQPEVGSRSVHVIDTVPIWYEIDLRLRC